MGRQIVQTDGLIPSHGEIARWTIIWQDKCHNTLHLQLFMCYSNADWHQVGLYKQMHHNRLWGCVQTKKPCNSRNVCQLRKKF